MNFDEIRQVDQTAFARAAQELPSYDEWLATHGPDQKRVPVSVVQAEIARPGSTHVNVTVDPATGEVTAVTPR